MTTKTETVSLPPTTAPSDVTTSAACLVLREPHSRRHDEDDSVDWDTTITPDLRLLVPDCRPSQAPCPAVRPAKHDLNDTNDEGHQSKKPRSVEESGKRSLHHFPRPAVTFSMPALEFDFRVAVTLNPEPSRVESRANKEIISVTAGRWSGSFGNGRITAGGYDLGQARGFRPIRIVEGAFVLQTTDEPPAALEMRTRGSLSGPCGILDTLLNPRQPKDIDPRQYGFRMFATVKSPDKRYAEIVNCGLWVASGMWHNQELIIDAYRVT
ncbi:hypothetical protein XA68_12215 [Ophiocordyceps unilateralis]|uniref:Outer membrane protein, beta-barrel n=1 Tax=Ophiocordyceps unilateralis TaxID=268505 RepID=A0A2A9PE00_OPHUN|nr:hypothetical protein XA68_12215 [Ophiocordyceps unilateralis]